MIFYLRFIVLQVILIAGVVAAHIGGVARLPFQGASGWLCAAVLAVFGAGMIAILLRRWKYAEWVATHVLRLGLLGTVVGLIIAFSAASKGISPEPGAMQALVAHVIDGMFVALFVTFFGVGANLWLKLNCLLLGAADGKR